MKKSRSTLDIYTLSEWGGEGRKRRKKNGKKKTFTWCFSFFTPLAVWTAFAYIAVLTLVADVTLFQLVAVTTRCPFCVSFVVDCGDVLSEKRIYTGQRCMWHWNGIDNLALFFINRLPLRLFVFDIELLARRALRQRRQDIIDRSDTFIQHRYSVNRNDFNSFFIAVS